MLHEKSAFSKQVLCDFRENSVVNLKMKRVMERDFHGYESYEWESPPNA